MIAFDTETTGIDLRHGAKPFFVTTCTDAGAVRFWQWDVNPLTREPSIPKGDVADVSKYLLSADVLVGQNIKFDVTAWSAVVPDFKWPWEKIEDTLTASHVLSSNTPHDLTALCIRYLRKNITQFESKLREAVNSARRVARTKPFIERHGQWRIADKHQEDMPSARGDEPWRGDMWLPRAVAKAEKYPASHPWWAALEQYSNIDSQATMLLWFDLKRRLERQKLWAIYKSKVGVIRVSHKMETRGITVLEPALDRLMLEYGEEAETKKRVCLNIAQTYGYDLTMPKGGSVNNSLRNFCFDVLKLHPIYDSKSKSEDPKPTLNSKEAIPFYQNTLPTTSKELAFINALALARQRGTALSYMTSYKRFWRPTEHNGYYVLHPSLNPNGTVTLRWSCANPNEQNISKKPEFNLRQCFGPAPGREWWSLDAKNIELRIPAYESGEEAFIALFERPNDPPYFGSNHLLISHVLHPEAFEKCVNDKGQLDGRIFKKLYEATKYKWTKNGNFAIQYNAGDTTADLAYRIPGARAMIKGRFTKQAALNDRVVAFAERHGYVETIPDKSIDPDRGYPLMCFREYGRVKPTLPLNYRVQGTAMQWMNRAMRNCQTYLDKINDRLGREDYFIIMQVHDELVFDFPRKGDPTKGSKGTNLEIVKNLQAIMEQGGEDLVIHVPTPVSIEYHPDNWSVGLSL